MKKICLIISLCFLGFIYLSNDLKAQPIGDYYSMSRKGIGHIYRKDGALVRYEGRGQYSLVRNRQRSSQSSSSGLQKIKVGGFEIYKGDLIAVNPAVFKEDNTLPTDDPYITNVLYFESSSSNTIYIPNPSLAGETSTSNSVAHRIPLDASSVYLLGEACVEQGASLICVGDHLIYIDSKESDASTYQTVELRGIRPDGRLLLEVIGNVAENAEFIFAASVYDLASPYYYAKSKEGEASEPNQTSRDVHPLIGTIFKWEESTYRVLAITPMSIEDHLTFIAKAIDGEKQGEYIEAVEGYHFNVNASLQQND